jgi:hypothetical protein
MSDIFSSILGSISNTFKTNPLGGGLGLMGLISQMSLASKEKGALDRSLWYSKHPEAIAAMESGFEKPLSAGLTKGVGNVVNASLAEQGLSQAPGIQSQVLAQALAPYQQNEQQMALMETFKALGLPTDALNAMGSLKDPNSLALLLKSILPATQNPIKVPGGSTPQTPDSGITLPPPFDPTTGQPPGGGPSIYG